MEKGNVEEIRDDLENSAQRNKELRSSYKKIINGLSELQFRDHLDNYHNEKKKPADRALDPAEEKLRLKRARLERDKLEAARSSDRPKYAAEESIEAASEIPACGESVNSREYRKEKEKKNQLEKEKIEKQIEKVINTDDEMEVEDPKTEREENSGINEEEVSGIDVESEDIRMKEREKREGEEVEESQRKIARFEQQLEREMEQDFCNKSTYSNSEPFSDVFEDIDWEENTVNEANNRKKKNKDKKTAKGKKGNKKITRRIKNEKNC